jgi:predicted 2-oxoglutarate/Fe(II)-dependent dioxygenase YbiX
MDLKKYIGIYDNFLSYPILSNLLKYCNYVTFENAYIIGEENNGAPIENLQVRNTQTKFLSNTQVKSYTEIHWANYLAKGFFNSLEYYKKDKKILDFNVQRLSSISLLKYKNTCFYSWHVDHDAYAPRTMSMVLMLNNDYEGGNLCFREPDGSNELIIDTKPNRMIVWPSTFLYPHTVTPVKKGIRYSVVCWGL